MNDIISVTYNNDRPTVSGRELHEKLGIKTAYKDWFPRMCEYGFTEGEDFNPLIFEQVRMEGDREVKRTITDHQLTIDMAKQICMIQRTDEGRRYREYFLEVERKWNSPEAVMGRALKIAEARLEAAKVKVAELEPKAAYFDTVAGCEGSTSFRETAKLFGVHEREFIKFVLDQKLCYRNSRGKIVPYAGYNGRYFEMGEVVYNSSNGQRTAIYTKITPYGRTRIFQRMQKAGLVNDAQS